MSEIPTRSSWIVLGKDAEGHVVRSVHGESAADAPAKLEASKAAQPDLAFENKEYQLSVPDRTLPTAQQVQGICRVLHGGLVMIRNAGHAGETILMREIAETLHNVPQEMFDERNWIGTA